MKFILLLILSLTAFSTAHATNDDAYTRHYKRYLRSTQGMFPKTSTAAPGSCNAPILEARRDGKIDITLVLGYLDVSGNQEMQGSWPIGTVLDRNAHQALEQVLQDPCPNAFVRTCGFKLKSGKLVKTIRDRWTGQNIQVTVKLASSSVSTSNDDNISSKKGQQSRASARAKQIFSNALKSSDAVFYLGHARDGGGPDFEPPVLYSNGNVNYSQYKREGINNMLTQLRSATRPAPLLAVLACHSTAHFSGSIKSTAPGSLLVTASDLFDDVDIVPTGLALIEALARQSCSREFESIVKVRPSSKNFLRVSF